MHASELCHGGGGASAMRCVFTEDSPLGWPYPPTAGRLMANGLCIGHRPLHALCRVFPSPPPKNNRTQDPQLREQCPIESRGPDGLLWPKPTQTRHATRYEGPRGSAAKQGQHRRQKGGPAFRVHASCTHGPGFEPQGAVPADLKVEGSRVRTPGRFVVRPPPPPFSFAVPPPLPHVYINAEISGRTSPTRRCGDATWSPLQTTGILAPGATTIYLCTSTGQKGGCNRRQSTCTPPPPPWALGSA